MLSFDTLQRYLCMQRFSALSLHAEIISGRDLHNERMFMHILFTFG